MRIQGAGSRAAASTRKRGAAGSRRDLSTEPATAGTGTAIRERTKRYPAFPTPPPAWSGFRRVAVPQKWDPPLPDAWNIRPAPVARPARPPPPSPRSTRARRRRNRDLRAERYTTRQTACPAPLPVPIAAGDFRTRNRNSGPRRASPARRISRPGPYLQEDAR